MYVGQVSYDLPSSAVFVCFNVCVSRSTCASTSSLVVNSDPNDSHPPAVVCVCVMSTGKLHGDQKINGPTT